MERKDNEKILDFDKFKKEKLGKTAYEMNMPELNQNLKEALIKEKEDLDRNNKAHLNSIRKAMRDVNRIAILSLIAVWLNCGLVIWNTILDFRYIAALFISTCVIFSAYTICRMYKVNGSLRKRYNSYIEMFAKVNRDYAKSINACINFSIREGDNPTPESLVIGATLMAQMGDTKTLLEDEVKELGRALRYMCRKMSETISILTLIICVTSIIAWVVNILHTILI